MMQFVSFGTEGEAGAWEKLGGGLGLLGLAEGQRWESPAGFPRMSGVSMGQGMTSNTVLLALDAPAGAASGAPGTAYVGAFPCGGMTMVYLAVYLYGPGAAGVVEREQPIVQAWMDERFPMPRMG